MGISYHDKRLTARASSILSNQYTVLLLHDKLLDCADDGETLLVR